MEPFCIFAITSPRLPARIAFKMIGTLLGDAGVIIPKVNLPFITFHSCAFLIPHLGDVQKRIWFPPHLFRLMRFKQIKLRRTQYLFPRIMTPSLRNHPTGEREIRGAHMIGVIRVVLRMAHHELWLHRTNDINHLILCLLAQVQRIIPKVQKFNVIHV